MTVNVPVPVSVIAPALFVVMFNVVPTVDANGPSVEMPIRDLLPDEEFRVTLMGVGVARVGAGQAEQFTSADRAMLTAIYQAMFPLEQRSQQ